MNPETSALPVYEISTTAGNDMPSLNLLQALISPATDALVLFWWCVWFSTLIAAAVILYRRRGGEHIAKH